MKPKIDKIFLELLSNYFPENSMLHNGFNKNTVKNHKSIEKVIKGQNSKKKLDIDRVDAKAAEKKVQLPGYRKIIH